MMARWVTALLFGFLITPALKAESFRVSAALEWRPTPSDSRLGGMLLLEIPLGRLARPPRLWLSEPPSDPTSASADASPTPPAATRKDPLSALPKLIDFSFARRLVAAALRVSGNPEAQGRLDGIARRARASALFPELTLRAARSTAQALRLSPSGIDSFDYTQTGGADLLLEARATWKLDRVVFSDEELRVESLRAARDRARTEIVGLVLKHLFAWQRARARLTDSMLDPEASLELELSALEAEAALDVLTDGFFSASQARPKRPQAERP